MLGLFRTNSLSGLLLVFFLVIMTRIYGLFLPVVSEITPGGVWSDWLFQHINPGSNTGQLLAGLLVFLQAMLANFLVNNYRLKEDLRNYVPAAVYVVGCGMFPEFLDLTPALIGNTFLLLALIRIMGVYKTHESSGDLYDTGLFLGLAALFASGYILFFLAVFAGWLVLRGSNFLEVLVIATGFFSPYFLTWAYLFVSYGMNQPGTPFFSPYLSLGGQELQGDMLVGVKLAFWGILIIFVLMNLNSYLMKKNIQVQKNISVLYWFLLVSGLMVFFLKTIPLYYLLASVVPLCIFLGLSLNNASKATGEIFFLLLLVSLLCFQVIGYNGLALI